jgi:glycosyltransferase involved in cell wall biosynthesis
MRVAYVCGDPGIPVFGTKGASVHVQEVIRALLQAGHEVELFCRRTGGGTLGDLATERLRVHELPGPRAESTWAREQALMRLENETVRALISAHERDPFNLVYERYALFGTAGTAFAREAGVPSVLEVNAPLPLEQAEHRDLVHADTADAVAHRAMTDATVVVCVSHAVAAWAREQTPRAHIVVEPNGVNADRFPWEVRDEGGPFTVGFVGTLKPWHGTETLIDAFARIVGTRPDARLLIIGDGPQRGALEALAAERGVSDRTLFTGSVAPDEVPGWLRMIDVATAPYPSTGDPYFSPLKVLEYLAAGAVVVASRIGQLPELVDDGRTGVLVEPSDPRELASALLRLAGDPALRRRLSSAGRAEIERSRTWHQVVERTLQRVSA